MPAALYPPRADGDLTLCTFPGCDEPRQSRRAICSPHFNKRAYAKERGRRAADRNEQGNKWCFGCETWKPTSEFHRAGSGRPDGLKTRCKTCSSIEYKARNYGMSEEKLAELLAAQGGACAVCGDGAMGTAWVVDHDHSCCGGTKSCGDCVRGILCAGCNTGIGRLGDSLEGVMRAVHYLQAYDKRKASV